jgi:glyoxylate utilization-related uncharacterized protein
MSTNLRFGACPHRCLFRNHCVEAHLLGLSGQGQPFDACVAADLTLIVTYGNVCARIGSCMRTLTEGDQVEIPRSSALQLSTEQEADVILVVS